MARYFVTSSAQFGFSGPVGDEADKVDAYVYVDGALKAVVGLNNGISEVESPPGTYTYHIVDKELSFGSPPSPGVVSIEWYAQDSGSVNADTYPTTTAPSLDTVADPTALGVDSTTPTANATDVSTRDAILIDFDADLDEDNLDASQIVLRQVGTSQRIPISWYVDDTDASKLVVKPRSYLAETVLYELLIKNEAVYSAGGDRMGSDFTLRFTTGADDVKSVHEASGEGTPDRAGPIVVGTSSILSSSPVASISSSVPSAGSYTFDGDQIVVTFDETLDAGVTPTVTLEFESIFGLNKYYYINNSFWNKDSEPTLPTVDTVSVAGSDVTIDLDSDVPGNAIMTITISGLQTSGGDSIDDKTLELTTALYPYLVGVPEVRRLVRDYASSDLTDDIIAQTITQVGLDLYLLVGTNAVPQQRCVIKHQVAMEVMDDWLAQNGGGMSESKTLGAFSVRRGGGQPPTYKRLQNKLDDCWYALRSYFNAPEAAIKGSSSYLERKDYRIRTWREARRNETPHETPNAWEDRQDKLPGPYDDWS